MEGGVILDLKHERGNRPLAGSVQVRLLFHYVE